MPKFAVYLNSNPEYPGPGSGFVSLEAEDAPAAVRAAIALAEVYDEAEGGYTGVRFAMPLEALAGAVDHLGNPVAVRPASEALTPPDKASEEAAEVPLHVDSIVAVNRLIAKAGLVMGREEASRRVKEKVAEIRQQNGTLSEEHLPWTCRVMITAAIDRMIREHRI